VSLVADYVIYSPLDPRFLEAVMKEAIEQTADQPTRWIIFMRNGSTGTGKICPTVSSASISGASSKVHDTKQNRHPSRVA